MKRRMTATNFTALLEALTDAEVEFIVVGGISAVLQGAPITTMDLGVVHNRHDANVKRLHRVLSDLNGFYRIRPDLRRCPSPQDLAGPGHHLLSTDRGLLDVLGELASGETYSDLLASCERITLDHMELHVQGLASLIRVKEMLGSEKHLAVLPTLRSTLEEKRLRGDA